MAFGKLMKDIGSDALLFAAMDVPNRFVARQIRADEAARKAKRMKRMEMSENPMRMPEKQAGFASVIGGGARSLLRAATVATSAGLLEQGVGNTLEDSWDSWRESLQKKKKPPLPSLKEEEKPKQAGFLGDTFSGIGADIVGQAVASRVHSVAARTAPGVFGTKEERDEIRRRKQQEKQEKQYMRPRTKTANTLYLTADGASTFNPNPIFGEFVNAFGEALTNERARYKKTAQLRKQLAEADWLKTGSAGWKTAVKQAMEAPTVRQRERYIKLAAASMGNATDVELETAVANLAMLYLVDKAPRLFENHYFFQILDKSDDNTQVVGVFCFEIGDEQVYVPTFFLNGELKGHELMYLYNKDQFRPLKENWINTLLNKKPTNIGQADTVDIGSLGVRYPDMRQLTQPPPLGKLAATSLLGRGGIAPAKIVSREDETVFSEATKKLDRLMTSRQSQEIKKAAEIMPAILDMPQWMQRCVVRFSKTAAMSYDDPILTKSDNICDLERICSKDFRVFRKLAHACDLYPTLKLGLDQFYGKDFFQKTWNRLEKSQQKAASIRNRQGLKFGAYQAVTLDSKITQDTGLKSIRPKRNVSVLLDVKKDDITRNFLNETQITRIIDGLPVAIDHRKHDEVSVIKGILSFVSPNKTGVYNVFMANGQIRECLVIVDPIGEQKNLERCLIVDWKRKEALRAKCRSVLCLDEPFNEDWFDRLPADEFKSPSSMENTKEQYFTNRIFIGKCGTGTIPLQSRITSHKNTNTGIYRLQAHPEPEDTIPIDYSGDAAYKPYSTIVTERMLHTVMGHDPNRLNPPTRYGELPNILVARKEMAGRKFVIREDKLYLPRVFKYIDLDWGSCKSPMALASENDIKNFIFKRQRKLKGQKTASDKYVLDSSIPLSYNKAFERLVLDYDFREKTAEEILTTIDLIKYPVEIPYQLPRVKIADMYSTTPPPPQDLLRGSPNVLSPTFTEPPTGSDPYANVVTQAPYQDVQQLGYEGQQMPTLAQSGDAPPPPDPMAMQSAQQATQTKQKDKFDVSTLVGLLKNDRNDDIIRDYAKIFKQALDRFGRLLFKYYWDKDFFSERFGEDKLQAIEDSLKDSLDKVGDLCLFIEEKDDRPAIADILGSVSLDESPEEAK